MIINNIKFQALLTGLTLWSCSMHAQNMVSMSSLHPEVDTISAGKKELAIRYPGLRQFCISVNHFGYSDFDAKSGDVDFASGKIRTGRISTFFNTPAVKWKGNSLSASIYYTYTSTELKDITNKLPAQELTPLTTDKSTFDLALNYSRSAAIFNHPIIYSLVARGITDGVNSFRRFNLNGSFNLPLKKTENTTFSVGLLVLVDPSAPIPVEPIVNYYHKFNSSGLELIVDLPTGVNLKKQVAKHAWVLVGSNQRSYTTFYDQKNAFLDGKVSYNTIELKNGAAFEYLFAKNIMLTVDGGFNSYLSAKLFKDGENYNNASFISSNKGTLYVNAGLSLLTF
ncbi:hypothetical protein Niako_1756 [Niastella koreensis GR20-10]|uniref:Outer membrane protein beta-barrel domain-containing protein n=2 Tax=Niastella koreensis TaxID=354356 RepID=G8TAF7_NIAKG|nr:hypothetical protein Niako_1756 [Niastella koreensis GR20-10]